jgi:hypothetical protein
MAELGADEKGGADLNKHPVRYRTASYILAVIYPIYDMALFWRLALSRHSTASLSCARRCIEA